MIIMLTIQPVSSIAVPFTSQELPMTVDLTNAIGCGKYRFICARIRKGDPVPDYTLVGPKSVVGCAPVTCESKVPLLYTSQLVSP